MYFQDFALIVSCYLKTFGVQGSRMLGIRMLVGNAKGKWKLLQDLGLMLQGC